LEIRVIVANVGKGLVFYIIGYGVDVSGIVAQFQVWVGIYFLYIAFKNTVRPIQPPVQ
jgi:hypothetical protein